MHWLSKKSTMMVGIDVTHPGMGTQEGTPSIAAVVASVDNKFVQFPASLRIQKANKMKEVILTPQKFPWILIVLKFRCWMN